jgi:hypothetical protein
MRRGGAPSAGVVRRWATGQIREVATANSFLELTAGSSSKEKATATKAVTVTTPFAATNEIPECDFQMG